MMRRATAPRSARFWFSSRPHHLVWRTDFAVRQGARGASEGAYWCTWPIEWRAAPGV